MLLFLTSCAVNGNLVRQPDEAQQGKSSLWSSCTPDQAISWSGQIDRNPESAFRAARCYAVLARDGKTRSVRLEYAVKGRKMAETAVTRDPENGAAHYLAAYLAGLEAENNALKGLSLVPVIEREALAASRLNPQLDHGGPDRMLGELYLRAPEPPVSIGNLEKAIQYYRRAVSADPGFVENRLGLVKAYLEDENQAAACRQLQQALTLMPPSDPWRPHWKRALNLMDGLCKLKPEDN